MQTNKRLFGQYLGFIICLITVVVITGSQAYATSVNSNLTVDNAFEFYISTNDSVQGTLIGYGSSWESTYYFANSPLTPGMTNYLHIYGQDFGLPAAFIGDFTLSDTAFKFSNGTQLLLTNTTDWKVYSTGWGVGLLVATSLGVNGDTPWGFHSAINAGAQWIWAYDSGTPRYFSAQIDPTSHAAPEPTTMLLLGLGLVGLAGLRSRTTTQ